MISAAASAHSENGQVMNEKKQKSFAPIVGLCIAIILIVTTLTVVFMPLVSTNYQSAAGSTAGSIIGTLLAFLGALYLWTKENAQIKNQERNLRDRNLLSELMAVVSTLSALDYPDEDRDSPAVKREIRLASIRLDESAAMIANISLKTECQMIANFARPETMLDEFFDKHGIRLYIARKWLLDLFALEEWRNLQAIRPERYQEITTAVAEVEDHYETLSAAYEQWLEEVKAADVASKRDSQ